MDYNMDAEYRDFIGKYTDVFPDGYCAHLISEFDRLVLAGAGSTRQQSENAKKHSKDDMQLSINFGVHSVASFNETPVTDVFFEGLQQCFDQYTSEFSVLQDGNITATHMKMQRTPPGGGYHLWHGEQGNGVNSSRVLTYMLYLNDIEEHEGGETEFLYQRLRIRPRENTMILWPAAYTHAHRGNPVLGDTYKYAVTGWFNYE